MNRILFVGLLGACLAGCADRPQTNSNAHTFFVAPGGSDQWSGRLAAPNRSKSDGPFATISHALTAARAVQGQANASASGAASIVIRRGTYFVTEPLVLGPEHSGVSIAAYPREKPVLSGGRRIGDWQPVTLQGKQLWSAQIPEAKDGKWVFRELWVNGRRAIRARHPNQGYLQVEAVMDKPKDWTEGQSRFRFRAGDLADWKTLEGADLVVMSLWVESHLPIVSVEPKERLISFGKRSVFALDAGSPYYVEGAFEALDEPGEWYLDTKAGTLYYLPRPGEDIQKLEAIAPVLTQVVRFEGRPEAGQEIQGVCMRGLTFAHTEWYFPPGFATSKNRPEIEPAPKPEVGGFGQAAIGVPGAVWGQGLRDCRFEDCSFIHLGNYGLELARGCQQNRILGCEFADLGAGGIKLGETTLRESPTDQTSDNEVSDCHIHDGAKLFHSAIGIWLGQTPNNRLIHNHIHDFYYTGISIGWTWGYGPARATNNLVAYNHVHHLGRKSNGDGPILSDMGGIYTLGMQPGTRIVNNLWHDVAGLRYGGWGIYFDEGSSSIVAESNVVYRTTHGGFHQHYGATNVVHNNIFAFARDHQLQRTRPEPHISFSFQTNIVYFDTGVLLGGDWSKDQYQMDWNLYFDARPDAKPEAMRFQNASLAEWRARGHDEHSIISDPLFVAPRQDDFRLQPNSPALQMGFQPIDLRPAGVREKPDEPQNPQRTE